MPDCIFNPRGVDCSANPKPCYKCGWNPRVDDERKLKTREQLTKKGGLKTYVREQSGVVHAPLFTAVWGKGV